MKIAFCLIAAYVFFCILLDDKKQRQQPEEEKPPVVNYMELSRRIEQLRQTDERLQSVEQLITDLEICSPNEYEKPVAIEWTTAAGNQLRYDLWIDGRANTERLLLVAYAERARLQESLLLQVDGMKAGERCNGNVNENVIYIDGGGK